MRVLIIGGTGLISTAITRFLVARGDAVTLYNRGQTKADIPEGYNTITGNRKDYATFEAQMTEAGNFDAVIDMIGFVPTDIESAIRNTAAKTDLNFHYTIPFVEGVRRIVAWLDARDRIHDKDESPIYSKIIEKWKRLSTKESFFGESDRAEV